MKIACLFDGAGLARLGLEQAGHSVTGFELDPWKHHLGRLLGSGNTILADATTVDISRFDGVWASPPCQLRSSTRTQGDPVSQYAKDYLQWCLSLPHDLLWVENVVSWHLKENKWGKVWNFASLDPHDPPRQNRNRIVGGRHIEPMLYRSHRKTYKGICPCVTATEMLKGCASDKRRASRFYGRRLTINEMAYHMGLDEVPSKWLEPPSEWIGTHKQWINQVAEGLGNGVPVWAAKAFGEYYLP